MRNNSWIVILRAYRKDGKPRARRSTFVFGSKKSATEFFREVKSNVAECYLALEPIRDIPVYKRLSKSQSLRKT